MNETFKRKEAERLGGMIGKLLFDDERCGDLVALIDVLVLG